MIDIVTKEECCGCGACDNICPVNSITMIGDEEGFLFPNINTDTCVNCGSCERVCPILNVKNDKYAHKELVYDEPKAIGGWIKDDAIRYDSSSGGAFSLFANYVLNNNGIVFGAALDKDLVVRHISIESIDELTKLRGSKYVQSEIGNTYSEVKDNLKKGRMVLFSGTPCQAAGLYSFLGNKKYDNLFIIDFICHGVPSPKVFRDYLHFIEEKYNDKVIDFKFRLKDKNWNPSSLQLGTKIVTENGTVVRNYPAFNDPYMNGFSTDIYLRNSCYNCGFKTIPKYYSDITIADFWKVTKNYPELNDKKGTSLVLLNSVNGEGLFDASKDNFQHKVVDFNKAISGNKSLIKSVAKDTRRSRFFYDYNNKSFDKIQKKYMNPFIWGVHKVSSITWNVIEKIIKNIVTPVIHLLGLNWGEENWNKFFQFIKFAMIGVSNVLVSYSINVCMLLFLHFTLKNFRYDYVIANITAFLLSVYWSYHWNSRKVFNGGITRKDRFKSLLKSYASYGFSGIVLNNVLSTFWINIVGISKFISPLMNIPITMPINFLILKKWAFKKN